MLWEDNYLAHYGIVKQRWGIRRFQNKDGSLTEEGRRRYGDFYRAREAVSRKMSSKVLAFKKKPVDVQKVMDRGKLKRYEADKCASLAERLFEKALRIEPDITRDIVSVVKDSGGTMYDLDNRIKQPTSIAAKIGADAKEHGVSFSDAAENIKDLIRYTSITNDDQFTRSYKSAKEQLEALGYEETRCKNYFTLFRDNKSRHKAIQCVFVDKDGNQFELQFHTPSSEAAKELKIPIYEERRKTGLNKSRMIELENQMTELGEKVEDPKGVFTIQSH